MNASAKVIDVTPPEITTGPVTMPPASAAPANVRMLARMFRCEDSALWAASAPRPALARLVRVASAERGAEVRRTRNLLAASALAYGRAPASGLFTDAARAYYEAALRDAKRHGLLAPADEAAIAREVNELRFACLGAAGSAESALRAALSAYRHKSDVALEELQALGRTLGLV